MKFDWMIVSAGFTGATLVSQIDQKVLGGERRDHSSGNAYDEHNEESILVHRYSPFMSLDQVCARALALSNWIAQRDEVSP